MTEQPRVHGGMDVTLVRDEGVECTFNMYRTNEGSVMRIAKGDQYVWYAATDDGWYLLPQHGYEEVQDKLEANFQKLQGAMQ